MSGVIRKGSRATQVSDHPGWQPRGGCTRYVGASDSARKGLGWPERPGWPNALSNDARAVRATLSESYEFNSPHSLATDTDGNLYVSEWLVGGRYTKLKIDG